MLAKARELHELAPLFVRETAAKIAATAPDVVGFTTTFAQNAAALAAARVVKELAPGTTTVFGGANCDGPQGAALHRNFEYVDFVVRGEGEIAFPASSPRSATATPMTWPPSPACAAAMRGAGPWPIP